MKYTPGASPTVAMEKTNEANGMTRDQQGRLVSAEHLTRRVTRYESTAASPSSPTVSRASVCSAERCDRQVRRLDLLHRPGGNAAPEEWDVTISGVYRVSADLGSMSLIVDDMVRPNGLAFSPDESTLYVADTRRRHVRAYQMQPNGTVGKETSRVFADLSGTEPGVPDGIKLIHPATFTAAAAVASTSSTRMARSSGASSMASPRRPMSRSAETIGRRSTSRREARSFRSPSRLRACRCQ